MSGTRYYISPAELPLAERDKVLLQKNPQRPLFFRRMITLAKSKRATAEGIKHAFNDVLTIRLMPNWSETLTSKDKLSLSEAFALVLEPFSNKQLNDLQHMLIKML